MIKTGLIRLDHDGNDLKDNSTTKKRRVNRYAGYTDAVWGTKTHGWAASTSCLDENKWKLILQAAIGRVLDPHALIEI